MCRVLPLWFSCGILSALFFHSHGQPITCKAPLPEIFEHTRTDPLLLAIVRVAGNDLLQQQQCCHARSPYIDVCGKHTVSPRLCAPPQAPPDFDGVVEIKLTHGQLSTSSVSGSASRIIRAHSY